MFVTIPQKLPGSWLTLVILLTSCCPGSSLFGQSVKDVVNSVQPKIVKIMGSGGFQGLEPFQTGIVLSKDGYLLTVWSYVLDSDVVGVTTDDGRRFEAQLIGYDPRIEIAVLKIAAQDLSWFNLDSAGAINVGNRILAFSNLYGVATGNESVSVQQGVVAAKTKLSAQRCVRDPLPGRRVFAGCDDQQSRCRGWSDHRPGRAIDRFDWKGIKRPKHGGLD